MGDVINMRKVGVFGVFFLYSFKIIMRIYYYILEERESLDFKNIYILYWNSYHIFKSFL